MKAAKMPTPTLLAFINTLELMSNNYYSMGEDKIKPAFQSQDIGRDFAEDALAKCQKGTEDIQAVIAELEIELGKRMTANFGLRQTPKEFGKFMDSFYNELERVEVEKKEREERNANIGNIVGDLDLDIPDSDKVIDLNANK